MAGISRLRTFLRRRVGIFLTRPYGSASAAQIEYDYYEDEEEEAEAWRLRQRTVAESDGMASGRGVQWVLMGEKKHEYGEKLSKLLQVPHISMGTLVRQELNPRSSLYQQIANAVNQGKLVQEDIIFGLLSKRLEEGYYRGETGFILEGIPRTRIQAEILDQIADIDLVVNFKGTEELLVKKHHLCGVTSREEFLSIRNSGSNLNHQPLDDEFKSPSTFAEGEWKEKLHLNAEQKKVLEDYYKRQKKLLDFQVGGAPSETWQGLLAALHLQHMNAVTSSQKLSAS